MAADADHDAGPTRVGRGRPRASSREVLEEAAYELFLEQGYDGTTVAEVAQRAGVSRGTFFNYFPAKADVFWGDTDAALDELHALLGATSPAVSPSQNVIDVLIRLAESFGPNRVPWILTQFEAVGRPAEVGASALARMNRAAEIISQFIAERTGLSPRDLYPRVTAYGTLAVLLTAAQHWAESGADRGVLASHLRRTLDAAENSPGSR
ncbi:MAG: TetR family transcriptional regulator [Leucobacter sp.]